MEARQFVRVDEDEEEESFVATRQVEMTSNAPAATVDARDLLQRERRPRLSSEATLRLMRRLFAACDGVPLRLMPIACGAAVLLILIVVRGPARAAVDAAAASGGRGGNATRRGPRVYLGNGCFWERQYAYVNIEMRCAAAYATPLCGSPFGRGARNVSSVVGYAGGTRPSPAARGRVCYHTQDGAHYGALGHAEAVQVTLDAAPRAAAAQFGALLADFFAAFGDDGARPDPGDRGAEYRSFIGVPGGAANAAGLGLANITAARDAHAPIMELRVGAGDEDDVARTVWIYDSDALPFHPAELYHQFHSNFMPPTPYEARYTTWLRDIQIAAGRIKPTGCPEGNHY